MRDARSCSPKRKSRAGWYQLQQLDGRRTRMHSSSASVDAIEVIDDREGMTLSRETRHVHHTPHTIHHTPYPAPRREVQGGGESAWEGKGRERRGRSTRCLRLGPRGNLPSMDMAPVPAVDDNTLYISPVHPSPVTGIATNTPLDSTSTDAKSNLITSYW